MEAEDIFGMAFDPEEFDQYGSDADLDGDEEESADEQGEVWILVVM